jgi:hypothetical protein
MISNIKYLQEHIGKSCFYDQLIIIDFYDGPIEGICKLENIASNLIFSIIYLDLQRKERIFSLLEIPNEWMAVNESIIKRYENGEMSPYKEIKTKIKSLYKSYYDPAYLFRGEQISDVNYNIVEVNANKLEYFSRVDDVLKQNQKCKTKWNKLFK